MAGAAEWEATAKSLGYPSEKAMWEDMYLVEEWSLLDIARKMGAGTCTINRRMNLCGIEKRSAGGSNNTGKFRKYLHYMDQREVIFSPERTTAKQLGVSYSTVYKYIKALERGKAYGLGTKEKGPTMHKLAKGAGA